MEIDHYINWDLAREQLSQLMEVLTESLRLVDAVRIQAEYIQPTDQLLATFLSYVVPNEEQIGNLSEAYTEKARELRALTNQLLQGEINNDVENQT